MNEGLMNELRNIVSASRDIAIGYGHGYIHTDHLFLAMLQQNCDASPYLQAVDKEKWAQLMQDNHLSELDTSFQESLPLTLETERVMKHAYIFVLKQGKKQMGSVDILLAMLAYRNRIEEYLSKAGLLQEDVLQKHYGAGVTWPALPLGGEKPPSAVDLAVMLEEDKQEALKNLYEGTLMLKDYGRYEEVVNICKMALSVDTANLNFMRLLAYTYYSQKMYEPIYPLVEKIEQRSEYPDWCKQLRVSVEGRQKNYTAALQILEQQVAQKPDDALLLNNMGYYLSKLQNFTAAVTHLEKSLQIDQEQAYAHNNLGFVLYRLGRLDAGKEAIQHSLKLDSGNSYAYKNLGIIYMETGERTKAREYFNLALKYQYTALYGDEVLELLEQLN